MNISNKQVIELAKSLEFDLVGFADAEPLTDETRKLKIWLEKGFHHKMSYMEKNFDKRNDIKKILPDAESVITLGINYYKTEDFENLENHGKVSRYAWGKDYHLIIWEKLKIFSEKLKLLDNRIDLISYVDTGPVMDKVWAVRGGLGWQGKHTNVISREIGSWFFIASVITNIKFESSIPQTDLCGTCTACIDACPTKAIVEPYVLDAGRCISNLTIENKGEIPSEFHGKFENWIFGCDICQEVCPWNHKYSTQAESAEFGLTDNREISMTEVKKLTNSQFKKKYINSPIHRAGVKGIRRNSEFLEKSLD